MCSKLLLHLCIPRTLQSLLILSVPISHSVYSEFLLSGLVHSECIVISLPPIWGHCSNGPEPALSYHWGTIPGRHTAVFFGLPHSSQTHPRECATGCLCECNTLITQIMKTFKLLVHYIIWNVQIKIKH